MLTSRISRSVRDAIRKNNYLFYLTNSFYVSYMRRKRKILTFMFYTTNRCNSRCKTCHIWKSRPKMDLPLKLIEDVLDSDSVSSITNFGLEGGEFILHPRFIEIIRMLSGRNYILLSNGVLDDRLIEVVKEYGVPHIHLSLDGDRRTHEDIRGTDNYDSVIRIIEELNGSTKISVVFTISPWNTLDDFCHVKGLCEKYNVRFTYTVYDDFFLFDLGENIVRENFLTENDGYRFQDYYLDFYKNWVEGEARFPCLSIANRIVVFPNGDIPLCSKKNIVLGNLYDNTLDEIWNCDRTKKLQKQYRNCNDCWISFHRAFDLEYIQSLEHIVPKRFVELLINSSYRFCGNSG